MFKLADSTRLELATSAVTGQRSNQLSYGSSRDILYYFLLFFKGKIKMEPMAGFEPVTCSLRMSCSTV